MALIIPPTMAIAKRLITFESVLKPIKMGISPAVVAQAVIKSGRILSPAPATMASLSSSTPATKQSGQESSSRIVGIADWPDSVRRLQRFE